MIITLVVVVVVVVVVVEFWHSPIQWQRISFVFFDYVHINNQREDEKGSGEVRNGFCNP